MPFSSFGLHPTLLKAPPEVSSVWLFELKVVGGTILLALAGRATFLRSKAVRG